MTKIRKKVSYAIILIFVFGLLTGQASAAWSIWRTFRLPPPNQQGVSTTITVDQNGTALTRTTTSLPANPNIISRRAQIGSQGQTMWSNPQVRVHRTGGGGSWTSGFGVVRNNNSREVDIPMANQLTYRVEARASSNQVGTDSASFRLNVQRYR